MWVDAKIGTMDPNFGIYPLHKPLSVIVRDRLRLPAGGANFSATFAVVAADVAAVVSAGTIWRPKLK